MGEYSELTSSLIKLLNDELVKEGGTVIIKEKDDVAAASFGELLKELRKKRKISQAELAKLAGVGVNTVIGIEKGTRNPTEMMMKKIIHAFDLDFIYLTKRK